MTIYQKLTRATAAAMIVSVGAMGGQALASGSEGEGRHMKFEQLDANGDGKLSREELKAAREARFALSDTNSDGKISKEEAVAKAGERASTRFDKMLKRLDTDKDGALTQAEMQAGKRASRMDKMFARADADGDGFLSQDEMKNMRGKHGRHKKD